MLDFNFKNRNDIYELAVGLTGVALIAIGCLIVMAPFLTALQLASIFALSGWPAYVWSRS